MQTTFNVKQGKRERERERERERMALRLTHSSRKETRPPLHQKKTKKKKSLKTKSIH